MTPHGEPIVWICERCDHEGAAYPGAMPRGWVKTPAGSIRCGSCNHNSVAAIKRAKMKQEGARKAARRDDSDEF
jgi:hypothetical protein